MNEQPRMAPAEDAAPISEDVSQIEENEQPENAQNSTEAAFSELEDVLQ